MMQTVEELELEIKAQISKMMEQTEIQKKAAGCLEGLIEQSKLNWAKELVEEEIKMKECRKTLVNAQNRFKTLTSEYVELSEKCKNLEEENEKLEKEIQRLKEEKLREEHVQESTKRRLTDKLEKLKVQKEQMKMWNDWSKSNKNKEIAVLEKKIEDENQLKVQELSRSLERKLEDYGDFVKGVGEPQKQELQELRRAVIPLRFECDDLQKKNEELERQIEILKKENPF